MEVHAIRGQKFHFVSLFYLDVFIHSSSTQAPIIKWKEAMERSAKMHSTHCLKIPSIFFICCKIAIENWAKFFKKSDFQSIFNSNFTAYRKR